MVYNKIRKKTIKRNTKKKLMIIVPPDLRNHELGGEGEGDLAQARHAARKADRCLAMLSYVY